jgi:uncharacterized surface protein with fasciclin (FAS1) repeats
MKRLLFPVALLAALIGLVRPTPSPASDRSSIYDTLAGMKNHTVLFVAVTEAKEMATLKSEEPHTLFAPTDTAFKKLDDATIQKIVTDKEMAKKIVQGHLISGKSPSGDLKDLNGKDIRMLNGMSLKVEDTKDGLRIGGVKITTANVQCSNGVIHVIDTVFPTATE